MLKHSVRPALRAPTLPNSFLSQEESATSTLLEHVPQYRRVQSAGLARLRPPFTVLAIIEVVAVRRLLHPEVRTSTP